MAGLPKDAASRLATDDVRAESPESPESPGVRRLASALRSQPVSINFRAADGALTRQHNRCAHISWEIFPDTCKFGGVTDEKEDTAK